MINAGRWMLGQMMKIKDGCDRALGAGTLDPGIRSHPFQQDL
jgi:hypothetical protein